jgi:DNA polymerase III alpha subunit
MSYAELQVTSNFSFLRGASSAQELFETAKALGIEALGVVDRNSLVAGSIWPMACQCWSIRRIALPIRGSPG